MIKKINSNHKDFISIEILVHNLYSTKKIENTDKIGFAEITIPHKLNIACNEWIDRNEYSSLSILKFTEEDKTITIDTQEDRTTITILSIKSICPPYVTALEESLGILTGGVIQPILRKFQFENLVTTQIHSSISLEEKSLTSPPFPSSHPFRADDCIQLIRCYLQEFQITNNYYFGYWKKIHISRKIDIEIAALTLTTSIEGIVKEYFYTHGMPDQTFIENATNSIPIIELATIDKKIKERLIMNLKSTENTSTKNALYNLEKILYINEKLPETWCRVRNASAHAGNLSENDANKVQNLTNDFFSCLELFYRLLLISINYKGTQTLYSQEGWPDFHHIKYPALKPHRTS